MPPIANLAELCEQLSKLPPNAIVGVEGFMNSGKSYLSNAIGSSLGCHVIHIDDCVAPGDESLPYIERLSYERLKESLSSACVGSSVVLVDGICLRQILARLEVNPAQFIYVKRMAANGLWHDGFHLEDYEADEQSIMHEPEKSDLAYHSLERPHERAELVFHRPEPQSAL
jgi:hypothetical protein